MKVSLVAVVLAFTGSALALIHADEPVKMRRDGTIVMINEPRSQYKEFLKRQELAGDIEEGTPTKTDEDGDVVVFNKRNAEPEVYMPRDGTDLQDPVRMDRFGRIIKARDYNN